MSDVLAYVALLINIYVLILFARVIMSWVVGFSQYRPTGAVAVLFEFVYTVTDPPLRFLRRFIPDIRMGRFSFDVSFIVLIIGLQIIAAQL